MNVEELDLSANDSVAIFDKKNEALVQVEFMFMFRALIRTLQFRAVKAD